MFGHRTQFHSRKIVTFIKQMLKKIIPYRVSERFSDNLHRSGILRQVIGKTKATSYEKVLSHFSTFSHWHLRNPTYQAVPTRNSGIILDYLGARKSIFLFEQYQEKKGQLL